MPEVQNMGFIHKVSFSFRRKFYLPLLLSSGGWDGGGFVAIPSKYLLVGGEKYYLPLTLK
jgi:hypothetical protein